MEITIMTFLLAIWDMYVNASHRAKIPQKDVYLFSLYEIYLVHITIDINLSKPQQDE